MAKQCKNVDLGMLQNEVENSTVAMKKATTELAKAKQAHANATERYTAAQKALNAGFDTVKAAATLAP